MFIAVERTGLLLNT